MLIWIGVKLMVPAEDGIAGQMAFTDPALQPYLAASKPWEYATAAGGAMLVLLISKLIKAKRACTLDPA